MARGPRSGARLRAVLVAALAALVVLALSSWHQVQAQTVVEPGFVLVRAWENLVNPTAVRFARNGRVFVVGKGGVIYTAASVGERNLKVAADLTPVRWMG